jgi:hypothetical protein
MKKFLFNFITFIVPFLILFVLLEISFRKIPNDYSYKNDFLEKNKNKMEIIILGNSHTFYGINPLLINKPNSFNASHVSQSLNIDLLLLEKYNFRNLKTLILPISYFTFGWDLIESEEKFRSKNYVNYYKLNIPCDYIDNFEIFNSHNATPLKTILKYYLFQFNELITINKKGWCTNYTKGSHHSKLFTSGTIRAAGHDRIYNRKLNKKNIEIVQKIIEICSLNKVKVLPTNNTP